VSAAGTVEAVPLARLHDVLDSAGVGTRYGVGGVSGDELALLVYRAGSALAWASVRWDRGGRVFVIEFGGADGWGVGRAVTVEGAALVVCGLPGWPRRSEPFRFAYFEVSGDGSSLGVPTPRSGEAATSAGWCR
jgi:hypothetical protein